MTIGKYINGFVDLLDKEHRPPTGFRWSARLVLFHTESVRSNLLDTKYNVENKPLDHQDMHLISCVELINASTIECEKLKELGCQSVLKIKYPLPDLISRKHLLIRSIDGSYVYDYVRWEDYTDVLNSKFEAERKASYYSLKREDNGIYVYILNDNVKSISIEGIFHNLIDPYLYLTCNKKDHSCSNYKDFKFPISPAKKNEMYLRTYESMLNVDRAADPDIINNESTDTINKTL